MNILNLWYVNVIAFLFFSVLWTQSFRVVVKSSNKDAAITILVRSLTGVITLIWIPFFVIQFPTDLSTYFFLGLAIIFYAIADRLDVTARRGLEASTFGILSKAQTIFMMIIGLLFFREPFAITKIIGALLIVFSNVLVLYKKDNVRFNKHVVLAILSKLAFVIAMSLDIGISGNFNLPLYIGVTFIVPSALIFLFERPKISDITSEFKSGKKIAILTASISLSLGALFGLRAYLLGSVTTVAPLFATTAILNVFAGYIFLKERDNLLKKILAAILIIFGIVLIQI